MIFNDKLLEFHDEIHNEFARLFDYAMNNQSHAGNMLLWHNNGFYDKMLESFKPTVGRKLNPHVIGPGRDGHSEHTHYGFINNYRRNIYPDSYEDYIESVRWDSARKVEIDALVEHESMSIQIEMMIYLKIWEADMTIKKLYEFVRILSGEHYDWYFKISESARDKGALTRQQIIRKLVRSKVDKISPILSKLIMDTYNTQIRNSIAHSNFYMVGRNIGLNNYIEEDKANQLHNVSFDEWINIFHKTIILYNELIWLSNQTNIIYGDRALSGETIEIQITEKIRKPYNLELEYRGAYKDWHFKQI